MLKTYVFLFIFASSKSSRMATKLHEKRHFALVFEKWGGGTCPVCPLVPTSMILLNTCHLRSKARGEIVFLLSAVGITLFVLSFISFPHTYAGKISCR